MRWLGLRPRKRQTEPAPKVRLEASGDIGPIHHIHCQAFDRSAEAELVDHLRSDGALALSLVSESDEGRLTGHLAASEVSLARDSGDHVSDSRTRRLRDSGTRHPPSGQATEGPQRKGLGIGPLGVLPDFQGQGHGQSLLLETIEKARRANWGWLAVLGEPDYYRRVGFGPASRFGLSCEYDVPERYFMALELVPDALNEVEGQVRFHPAFAATAD